MAASASGLGTSSSTPVAAASGGSSGGGSSARFADMYEHENLVTMTVSDRRELYAALGRHPDFPKPGILFFDYFPLFLQPRLARSLVFTLAAFIRHRIPDANVIVGLDSRGFTFGPAVAMMLDCAFVPVRKAGKLPGEVIRAEYTLEYGSSIVEVQKDAVKPGMVAVIVDDLIATGGTLAAAARVLRAAGAEVRAAIVVVELPGLEGHKALDVPAYTVLRCFEDAF